MSVGSLTYNLESAAKEYREASEMLENMKAGNVTVELSISHTYVTSKLSDAEKGDLNGLALSYLERRVQDARARLIELGMKPVALEPKE